MDLENKIAIKEKAGRDKVMSYFGNKYDFVLSENPGDQWDLSGCTYNIGCDDKNYFIEVKDRDISSTSFNTCILEYKKFESLKDLSKEYNADIFYTCLYTDDIMYMFNLRKLTLMDVSLTTINAPKISMQDHYNKIPKLMIELPFALGTRYKLKK